MSDSQGLTIKGLWFDGEQSTQLQVVLRRSHDNYVEVYRADSLDDPAQGSSGGSAEGSLHDPAKGSRNRSPEIVQTVSGDQLRDSSRLGNSTRYIYFPNGQKLETRDNDGVDALMRQLRPSNGRGLLHYLESRWSFVLVSTVLMVCLGVWVFTDGVPTTSKYIAKAVPEKLKQKADEQTLNLMDEQWMEPSTLSEEDQQRVRQHFANIIHEYQDYNVRLLFRDGGDLGANAFALPDGTIIFTDDLIKLSRDDNELLAIMAHEVGHVVHNHGMRNLIQSSMIGFVVAIVAGDTSFIADVFLTLPVLLTQLGYSRDFEREADDFALEYLLEKQLSPNHFVAIMTRLDSSHCEKPTSQSDSGGTDNNTQEHCHNHNHNDLRDYFSTHPATKERLDKFKQAQ